MWIDYDAAIGESAAQLLVSVRREGADRRIGSSKLLRLLKSGRERSLRGAVTALGYTERRG